MLEVGSLRVRYSMIYCSMDHTINLYIFTSQFDIKVCHYINIGPSMTYRCIGYVKANPSDLTHIIYVFIGWKCITLKGTNLTKKDEPMMQSLKFSLIYFFQGPNQQFLPSKASYPK